MLTGNGTIRILRKKDATQGQGESRVLCGRDYIVIPVVALVEGVRHAGGAPSPELVLAESFGRHVETWNGRPIVVNHPVDASGNAVLASSPDILESSYLGELLNARVEDGKLIVDAWLDLAAIQASESAGVIAMWKKLIAGEVVEVSVGAIVYTKAETGTYKGKKYSGRWNIVIPDHLAFLDGGQIGACSVADGCGTYRSQKSALGGGNSLRAHYVGTFQLSEAMRMAAKNVVRTIKAVEAQNADKPCSCSTTGNNDGGEDGDVTTQTAQEQSRREQLGVLVSRMLFNGETFDRDRRALLQRALMEVQGNNCYVISYNDNVVVYETYSEDKYKLFQIGYTSDSDNNVVIADASPTEVMFQMKSVPVGEKTEKKGRKMAGKRNSSKQIAASQVDEDEIDEMEDDEGDEVVEAKPLSRKGKPREVTLAGMLRDVEDLGELEKRLAGTPVGKQLSATLKVAAMAREKAVKHILAQPNGAMFDADTLNTMEFGALDKLATFASVGSAVKPANGGVVGEKPGETVVPATPAYQMNYMSYGGGNAPAGTGTPQRATQTPANGQQANFVGRAGGRAAAGSGGIPKPPDVFAFDANNRPIKSGN